jgi:UDP-glucose 4-epimerase
MKVLVTGATGFIGRQLVPALREAGHDTRVLVRAPRASDPSFADSELVIGSLPDSMLAQRLCAGIDAVVYAAGHAHAAASVETLRKHNVAAPLELAHAARAQGVRRFVFLSSSKARYPEHSDYARLKAEAETALRSLHVPGSFEIVCLRPALVYGRGMRGNLRGLLRVLARPRLPVFIVSDNRLGMLSVQDLSRAIVAALQAPALPDRVWELADGQSYTLSELVRVIRSTLGLRQPSLTLPRPVFRLLAALAPLLGGGLSLATYRTLYEEDYAFDAEFSHHTGFAAEDSFLSRLPELLEELA